MTNLERASALLGALRDAGCREVAVCGGSRNAPLIAALAARRDFLLWNFFEERSAAFFAVGRIRATRRPVAVVTTSGTAAAELLPATIEAHYAGDALILVTADRPERHRGTGAPQAIEQVGLFGPYVEASIDLPPGRALDPISWSATRPLHINIGFDEPLLAGDARPVPSSQLLTLTPREESDPEACAREITAFLERSARPLILIGGLTDETERDACRNFAIPLGAPIHAEPLSGLREDLHLETLILRSGESILRRGDFDAVLRLGSVPALRYWRDLDEGLALPVLSASRLPFGGLGRGTHLRCDLAKTLPLVQVAPRPNREIHRADHMVAGQVRELFEREKRSEPALVRELSEWIPEGSLVYLGNSLPIREWDLYATRRRRFSFGANRGANGIDGQLSTFLGMVEEGRENWCVVGDLTALYDLSSPWVIPQIAGGAAIRIVIVNNRGGRIFSRVPSLGAVPESERERLFENPHAIGFEQWAAMWGLEYYDRLRPRRPLAGRSVIELRPEADQTARFLEAYDALARGTP